MYYPKSQITTNLYTNGDEFILKSDSSLYVGYYWKTSGGKFFTGKTPQSLPVQELISLSSKTTSSKKIINLNPDINPTLSVFSTPNDFSITDYPKYTYIDQSLPLYSPNIPKEKDYKLGEFIRYFCKKTNEIIYTEIDKTTYNKLINKDPSLVYTQYSPYYITWRLTGKTEEEVYKINRNIVKLTIKQYKLPQFDLYLKKDYTKYYQ